MENAKRQIGVLLFLLRMSTLVVVGGCAIPNIYVVTNDDDIVRYIPDRFERFRECRSWYSVNIRTQNFFTFQRKDGGPIKEAEGWNSYFYTVREYDFDCNLIRTYDNVKKAYSGGCDDLFCDRKVYFYTLKKDSMIEDPYCVLYYTDLDTGIVRQLCLPDRVYYLRGFAFCNDGFLMCASLDMDSCRARLYRVNTALNKVDVVMDGGISLSCGEEIKGHSGSYRTAIPIRRHTEQKNAGTEVLVLDGDCKVMRRIHFNGERWYLSGWIDENRFAIEKEICNVNNGEMETLDENPCYMQPCSISPVMKIGEQCSVPIWTLPFADRKFVW